jgi:NAD(P)H-flavin reductase
MIQKLKGNISNIIELTPTVKHFQIELSEEFNFIAGQFINISFTENDTLYRKPYSIASNPNNSKQIELCIKLVEEGHLTPVLWNKEIGFEVEVMGPLGLFNNENIEKSKIVLIGTGTGIAPLRSIIFDEIKKQSDKEITLIFGARHNGHHLYDSEFKEIEKISPNFKYIPILSKPDEKWEGRTGYVQDNLDYIDPLNSICYICGLPQMVEAVENKLIDMGLTKEQIKHEKY